MEEIKLTRQELYDLVWSEPLSRLARKYKISDNGLRKICKRMSIPLPILGYWQKAQYKKTVLKIKLPKVFKGEDRITLCYRDSEGNYVKKVESPSLLLKKEIQNDLKLPLKVPERLTNPDPIIIKAQNTLQIEKRKSYNFNGFVETVPGELHIRVTPTNVGRALRFMDAFIKLLRTRNNDVILKNGKIRGVIYEVDFEISLKEKMKIIKTQDRYGSQEYHPTGILAFVVDSYPHKEWVDGAKLIESKLTDILVYLELKCNEMHEYWLDQDRKRQI